MDFIVIEGVPPYDGRHELDLRNSPITTREWGWLKRYAGYLPLTLTGDAWADPEAVAVFAIMALRRNHVVEVRDVPDVWERFADVPFGATIQLELGTPDEEDGPSPPPTSSISSETSSGDGSKTSTDPSDVPPSRTGRPGSVTSVSVPVTSAS